ncbi:MAG: ankyrin repeat domain-containing protein [Cyanobacteria bacterium]|nr:ankyrin repeat domain-containing protein [Cyanobacteriota bacterium]
MALQPLPFNAPIGNYAAQADALLDGWRAGNNDAIKAIRNRHPKFLDDKIKWLERHMTDAEVRATPIDRDDARLALARWYDFQDWQALEDYAASVQQAGPIAQFERAVEAVIDGDIATLKALLKDDPRLVRARSTRVNNFDPPMHRATLLHYLAANGVEGYRQRSPKNAAEVAKLLLSTGADPNALSSVYGGKCTTLALLVSSTPPAEAGVQVPLVEMLVDFGASMLPAGEGEWTSPVETALVFGKHAAAKALVCRGAPVKTLAAAAGLGYTDDVKRMLPSAGELDRHRALALAAQCGHPDVVGVLLDAGEDPNRFNPPGTHSHTPPLHQAIAAGHLEVVKVLIDRGARLDIKDTIHHGTPLGWAKYCDQPAIADYLRSRGAP